MFASLVGLAWLFFSQAWMVDDAYITMRTVHNFVTGHGLTWNSVERVQAYTHPLWMFCLSALYFVSRESFFVPLFFSFALLLWTIFHVEKTFAAGAPWKLFLFLGLLVVSKAFFDYTSSGLENPLTHLLIVFFYGVWLFDRPADPELQRKRYLALLLFAALSFFNRVDTLLLFLPALVWETIDLARRQGFAKIVGPFALGTLPATGWLLFAIVYYGAPFPNTAYAKALHNGVGAKAFWQQGGAYFLNTLDWDPPTLVFMALAVVWAVYRKDKGSILAAAGMSLYLLYVAKLGAGGTHMGGRFFSGPFLVAALILLVSLRTWREALPVAALAVAFVFLSPGSPLLFGVRDKGLGNDGSGRNGIIDTHWYVQREGASLLAWERGRRWPNHGWYDQGREFRRSDALVRIGGAGGGLPIGYFGFGAGPEKFVIDLLGLSDPLLARLPMKEGTHWWGGHFRREVPEGYVDSVVDGVNRIRDPDLKAFYDKILLITRGPIFDGERFAAIWELHTGKLQPLIDAYAARHINPPQVEEPEPQAPVLPRQVIGTPGIELKLAPNAGGD